MTLAYAQEVYAACATIGFTEGPAETLKTLLDRQARGDDVADCDLQRAAQDAHRAAANWAGRR